MEYSFYEADGLYWHYIQDGGDQLTLADDDARDLYRLLGEKFGQDEPVEGKVNEEGGGSPMKIKRVTRGCSEPVIFQIGSENLYRSEARRLWFELGEALDWPHGEDTQGPAESEPKGTGVQAFDPTDPEAVLGAVIELRARLAILEARPDPIPRVELHKVQEEARRRFADLEARLDALESPGPG